MASSVIRIEYKNTSSILDLNDIAFVTLEESDVCSIKIVLTFSNQLHTITIDETDSDEFEELKIIYMDLFTKWKKKVDADKEDERLLYSL